MDRFFNRKRNLFVAALMLLIIIVCFFLFSKKTPGEARINSVENRFVLTIVGERNYMPHDVWSVISDDKYLDSVKLTLPRKHGTIKGGEIPVKKGRYGFSGKIIINEHSVIVNLLINNTDDQKIEKYEWNGQYELKHR